MRNEPPRVDVVNDADESLFGGLLADDLVPTSLEVGDGPGGTRFIDLPRTRPRCPNNPISRRPRGAPYRRLADAFCLAELPCGFAVLYGLPSDLGEVDWGGLASSWTGPVMAARARARYPSLGCRSCERERAPDGVVAADVVAG